MVRFMYTNSTTNATSISYGLWTSSHRP